jgi:hypothetical protein
MYLDVTWQINSENVSTFSCGSIFLANNIKIAITPTLLLSVAGSGESADADRLRDEVVTHWMVIDRR